MKSFINTTISIIFIFAVFALPGYSQINSTDAAVKGTVVDKSTGNPMESATIQIFRAEDSTLVTGASSDKDGSFLIGGVPTGTYNIKISYVGYATAVARNVKANKKEINLGKVQLEVNSEMTQQIDVVDEAPALTFEAGKKVYDVKKDLTSKNGTVLDMLKNIPSVDVDNDGNVSLRGSGNVKILIDGKPSALLSNGTQVLQNIPATMVEKVEIINNPSAKYEAEGVSGILNIIMKPSDNLGYSGNIKVNGGTEDKYNFATGGSVKKGKWTLNGNYSYWNYYLPGKSQIYRDIFGSTGPSNITTNLDWNYKGISHYGSFGADYDINKFNTISFAANLFVYKRNLKSTNNLDVINTGTNSGLIVDMDDGRKGYNFDATVTYSKKYEQKEKELTAFVNFSSRKEESPVHYINHLDGSISLQDRYSNFYFNFLNGQADFVQPLGGKSKLETGVKSDIRSIEGTYTFKALDSASGIWTPIPGMDNDASYRDAISAAYVTYSGGYKDFTYQAGLRGEHTYIDFSIMQGTQKYNKSYFDIFPSVSLSQKIGTGNQIQASYSRRINRPNLFLLNPFIDQFDAYTKRSGNPYLESEYINSIELGYTRFLPFGSVTISGYYRNLNNMINFVSNVDSNGVTLARPENAGKSNTIGTEIILQGGLAKWWTFNGSFSYFNTNLFNKDPNNNFDKTYDAWSARFSTNASIPNIADVSFTYFYFGKQQNSQGSVDPMQMFNFAVQKGIFDKKLVIGFRVNDLFNQQKFFMSASGNNFNQTISQKSNSRTAYLTLTFNFGDISKTTSQKTSQRKQREVETEIQQTGN
ncbi:MAG: TonB-dependent receptor [Ignavibacteria bacterium]|nr:TonB-dependent receptor [Ignavibacteria bacterium]